MPSAFIYITSFNSHKNSKGMIYHFTFYSLSNYTERLNNFPQGHLASKW